MKTAQEYLNKYYSKKKQTEKIDLKYLSLNQSSELIIKDYPNLREIQNLKTIPQITKITISNCPRLEKVIANWFTNNQELILNNCPNLKEIYCSDNNLATLDLSQNKKLEILDLRDNN